MGKWNKKWDKKCSDSTENFEIRDMKKKMSNLVNRRRENPKKIKEFEDIYQRPQQSNIEGFGDDDTTTHESAPGTSTGDIGDEIKDKISNVGKAFSSMPNPIDSLQNDMSNTFDGLGELGNFDMDIGSMFSTSDDQTSVVSSDTLKDSLKNNMKGIKGVATEVGDSMLTLSKMITNVFLKIGAYLRIIKIQIMLFFLRTNRYVTTLITNIANALTQDTATKEKITTFQDQTQKFISILLTWFFVYNWYYIVFFLEDEDNVRYEINTNDLKDYNKILYGALGPAFRVVEWFDYLIIGAGKKIKKWEIPNAIIMFGMFLLFYSLVQMNFQTSLLANFFNALRGQYSISVLSLGSIAIVAIYSLQFMFGSVVNGNMEIQALVTQHEGGIFSMCFFLVIVILCIMAYSMWTVAVNVPLGVLCVSTYLAVYSFMGVFVYEGFNCFNIITGITDSIDTIVPDLTDEACKPEFEVSQIPKYIWDWIKTVINYASINMFEILILLTLLGGIGVYSKNWNSSIAGKVGMSATSTFNIQESFKQLFTWLILINILLIIMLCMYLYNKYKTITGPQSGTDGVSDQFKSDQTMRSRMAGLNNSLSSNGPVMKKSKIQARQTENIIPSNTVGKGAPVAATTPVATTPVAATGGSGDGQ